MASTEKEEEISFVVLSGIAQWHFRLHVEKGTLHMGDTVINWKEK